MLTTAVRRAAWRSTTSILTTPSASWARMSSSALSPLLLQDKKQPARVSPPNLRGLVFPFSTTTTTKDQGQDPKDASTPKKPSNVTEEEPMIAHFTQSSTRHALGLHEPPATKIVVPKVRALGVYDLNDIQVIEQTHHPVTKAHERAAYFAVKLLRVGFDILSGYRGPGGGMKTKDWLHRCLFLETVAGVPGMVGGMWRHLRSLRTLRRDYGWIHTLLEEAENERMHLLIFLNMKRPGFFFRVLTVGAQGVFFTMFLAAYMVSPRSCHRFVGYLEEEAVKTYTCLLEDIENGYVPEWKEQIAPVIAQNYYKLPSDATVLDMIKCIRADEANHRDVNHTFANLDQKQGVSPFGHRVD